MSHREKEWTEDYKTKQWKSRRHHRCIERRSLFAISISNLYTKRLSQNSYQKSVRYASVALCAVSTSVTLHYLRPLRDSVCLLYKPFNLSSIFGRTSYYPVTMSFITMSHAFHYPVTMSFITMSHVFHYSVTMSLITLSHVSHYPVPRLPLPCLHQGMQNHKKELTS